MAPSAKFAESIAANITYWQTRLREPSDEEIKAIDLDRTNLYRAIEFGMGLPEFWQDTANLVVQCFPFIVRRGYYRDWIPVLENLTSCCADEDLALKGRLLDQLGILYRRNRQLDAAIASHLEEERIGEELDDTSRKSFARMHLSAGYWRKRQYDTAERYGLAALEGFSGLDDNKEKVASCFVNLGNIALGRGDLKLAEERVKRSIELYSQLGNLVELANALKNHATVYETAGRYDEALLILIEVMDILATTDFEIDKAMTEINIGTLYFRKEQLDLAEAAFRRAESPYMKELGPIYYRALTANNLGNVYLVREEWERAQKHLRVSVRLFRQAKSQINLANALSGIAEALVGMKRSDEAVLIFDEAIEIVTAYPDDAWAQRLLMEFTGAREKLIGDNLEKG